MGQTRHRKNGRTAMQLNFREKKYFDERATREKAQRLHSQKRTAIGFDEAKPDDFIEVDADLNTPTGKAIANPATRFHLWIHEARPDVSSIIHTHSPGASAPAAARQSLAISQINMTCDFRFSGPAVDPQHVC
jgi:ribulose-5-phosphate 4-epimerase/fuculose-1-phosphate aldolase